MSNINTAFMQRCLDLALSGRMRCRPNPMVGAVLVHKGRIIGEGYHEVYGGPHAEVNCLGSAASEDRALIPQSTLYVSLEPCCHHGKTPPCTDLIIASGIRQVVVGCRDLAAHVNGQGIARLRAAGVDVHESALSQACRHLNRRFFTLQVKQRPYIILKWAESADGFIAPSLTRHALSNAYTNVLVHRWRSEESAIWVGYRTALTDAPALTVRLTEGPNPCRLVYDRDADLPPTLPLFNDEARTLWFNHRQSSQQGLLQQIMVSDTDPYGTILKELYQRGLDSVLVEGGAGLHAALIRQQLWDEIRLIRTPHVLGEGIPSAALPAEALLNRTEPSDTDRIDYYFPKPGTHA